MTDLPIVMQIFSIFCVNVVFEIHFSPFEDDLVAGGYLESLGELCSTDVNVEIEADDCDVSVTVYLTVSNNYWTETFKRKWRYKGTWQERFENLWKPPVNAFLRKLKFTWEVWIKGETKFQTTMVMSAAAAKNYSAALDKAADDVKMFRQERTKKNAKTDND
jgi:hypothetical protein